MEVTWQQTIGAVAMLLLLVVGAAIKWRAYRRRKRESSMEEDIDRLSDDLNLGDKP